MSLDRRAFALGACFASIGALAGGALAAGPDVSTVPAGPIDAATTLGELVDHPAFNGGGLLLLPWYGRREDLEAPSLRWGRTCPTTAPSTCPRCSPR